MRMHFDRLKHAKLLEEKGFKSETAQGLIATLSRIEIVNLYSKQEVDMMLSEAVEKVFAKQDARLA